MAASCLSGQVSRDDSREHDPVERAGAADAGDAGGEFGYITKMEEIGPDERAQDAGDAIISVAEAAQPAVVNISSSRKVIAACTGCIRPA